MEWMDPNISNPYIIRIHTLQCHQDPTSRIMVGAGGPQHYIGNVTNLWRVRRPHHQQHLMRRFLKQTWVFVQIDSI